MSANATLTNLNATESIHSTTNPIPTGDLVTSSISEETFTSDVIARQQESTDTCLIEYPLWRSGDNCMDKQLTENVLFGLSIGKSIILYFVNSAPTINRPTARIISLKLGNVVFEDGVPAFTTVLSEVKY